MTGSFDDVQQRGRGDARPDRPRRRAVWTSGDGIGNGVAAAADQAASTRSASPATPAASPRRSTSPASSSTCIRPIKPYVDGVTARRFGKKFFVSGLANHGLVLTPVNTIDKRVAGRPASSRSTRWSAELASGKKTLPDFYGK